MEKETLRLIFGLKVHLLRQQRGLTLGQLAEKTGTVVSYLHDIEKGKKYPSADKIMALASALGTGYDELVALGGMKQVQPIVDLLRSDFFRNYPLEVFGLRPEKVIEMMSGDPAKMSAFVSAVLKIARSYDLNRESLYMVALRSFQDMHDNHFPDLEEKARAFRAAHPAFFQTGAEQDAAALTRALAELHGIRVDRTALPAQPALRHIRSYFAPGKRLLHLNSGLSTAQERFLLARELGFQTLGITENRPLETIIQQAENFDLLLHNLQASYFASALLMPPADLAEDIRRCGSQLEWQPGSWLALLQRYNVTPEMLLQRFTNVLPGQFGLKDLFFIRLQGNEALDHFAMTKELHLSGQQSPYATERDQHYCRRWVSVGILQQLRRPNGPEALAMAQISQYHDSSNQYVVLSMAKAPRPGGGYTSVSLGLRLSDEVQRLFRFVGDPALVRKTVGSTCETCALPDCDSRAAAPVVLERQAALERTMQALANL
jgi:hypothetical protein